MQEVYENDAHRIPKPRPLPITAEEIAKVQAEIEKSFAEADEIRKQCGLPPLDNDYRISRYVKLRLPIPEHYQKNS